MTSFDAFVSKLYKVFQRLFFSLEGEGLTPKPLFFGVFDTIHFSKPYKLSNNTPFGDN